MLNLSKWSESVWNCSEWFIYISIINVSKKSMLHKICICLKPFWMIQILVYKNYIDIWSLNLSESILNDLDGINVTVIYEIWIWLNQFWMIQINNVTVILMTMYNCIPNQNMRRMPMCLLYLHIKLSYKKSPDLQPYSKDHAGILFQKNPRICAMPRRKWSRLRGHVTLSREWPVYQSYIF